MRKTDRDREEVVKERVFSAARIRDQVLKVEEQGRRSKTIEALSKQTSSILQSLRVEKQLLEKGALE